jgi:hypothetical protein
MKGELSVQLTDVPCTYKTRHVYPLVPTEMLSNPDIRFNVLGITLVRVKAH